MTFDLSHSQEYFCDWLSFGGCADTLYVGLCSTVYGIVLGMPTSWYYSVNISQLYPAYTTVLAYCESLTVHFMKTVPADQWETTTQWRLRVSPHITL